MKTNIKLFKQKTFEMLRFIAFISGIIAIVALTQGCKKLDIQQNFEWQITHLPIPSELLPNETVEIRFKIKSIDGTWNANKYYVRYFQYAGKGVLAFENGENLLPNDTYEVEEKVFRMYFQPSKTGSHSLELVFFDSFENEKIINLNFTVEEPEVAN